MFSYLLRSLSVAGFFSILIVAFAGSPANAGSVQNAVYKPAAGTANFYTEVGRRGKRWKKRGYHRRNWRGRRHYRKRHLRKHRFSRRHFRRHRHRHHRRHRGNFGAAFGLGVLGGALLSRPYVHSYVPRRNSYCHVHRYRVPGMTFHRDVRCFKHRNWGHPSIVYVR